MKRISTIVMLLAAVSVSVNALLLYKVSRLKGQQDMGGRH